MSETMQVTIGQRGVVTLPKALRTRYHWQQGDRLTVIDLDGVLVLSPGASRVDHIANSLAQELAEQGETLESMLTALREERARYDG